MAFETRLRMLQQQRMIMTPMLQEAIRLLTLTRMDLIQELRTQLEVNPILDERNRTALLAVELILSAMGKRIY